MNYVEKAFLFIFLKFWLALMVSLSYCEMVSNCSLFILSVPFIALFIPLVSPPNRVFQVEKSSSI